MLNPGMRLGSYEVQTQVGAGGMGEVYQARDPKLDRTVAIKVLASHLLDSPTALARFEREARAVAALSHPNVLSIFDFGEQDGLVYAVMEFLEGQNLRELIRCGPIPLRQTLEIAGQIAEGLAAAHAKGIIHRDLKPENVFLTRDGKVKILDFGLARQLSSGAQPLQEGSEVTRGTPEPSLTGTGLVMGTTRYMSPEQVRGQGADTRSDIFSFGVVLWEMLTGAPPFHGDEVVDTFQAILKADPPEIPEPIRVPPTLERILRHCLNKRPEERFQSAKDLAFQLQNLSASGPHSEPKGVPAIPGTPRRLGARWLAAAAVALLLVGALAGFGVSWWRGKKVSPPSFRPVWNLAGQVQSAQIAPNGKSLVLGLLQDDGSEVFYLCSTSSANAVQRKLPIPPGSQLLAISARNELALLLPERSVLAVLPLEGNALPREITSDILSADWDPRTMQLAVVRTITPSSPGAEVGFRLEHPIGTPRYESRHPLTGLRFSPSGDRLVAIEVGPTSERSMLLFEGSGAPRKLVGITTAETTAPDLEWNEQGTEILFRSLSLTGCNLTAVDLVGRKRLVHRNAGNLLFWGRGEGGRYLMEGRTWIRAHRGVLPGRSREEDLSWLGGSVWDFGTDQTVLIKTAEGGAALYYLDRDQRLNLSSAAPEYLSPDGQWVVGHTRTKEGFQVRLVPTGPGLERTISSQELGIVDSSASYGYAVYNPHRRRILVTCLVPGQRYRLHLYDLDAGKGYAWKPEGEGLALSNVFAVSEDGQRIAVLDHASGAIRIHGVEDGKLQKSLHVPGTEKGIQPIPIAWSKDQGGIMVWEMKANNTKAQILRMDLATGQSKVLRTIEPGAGHGLINEFVASRDGSSYAYTYIRRGSSTLYFVEGMK